MNCAEARKGLWPPERPRLAGDEIVEARRHVDGCPDCQRYFEQDRALLDLYDRARQQEAPLEVREGVFDALARARWGRRESESSPISRWSVPWAVWGVSVVSGLVTVAAIGFIGWSDSSSPPPAEATASGEMFVEDYFRRAVGADFIETGDRTEVQRFLERELGMPFHLLEGDDLEVLRAEICLLEGRRGAMIRYRQGDAEVSHYLVPQTGNGTHADQAPSFAPSSPDMPVVVWANDRVEQAVLGELSGPELMRLARGNIGS